MGTNESLQIKPIQVVLIEDDPMVREIHRQFVEQVQPFVVVGAASNGIEGLELIRRHEPELAILDIFMPMHDGLETLKQMRGEGLRTDIIAVTAASDSQTIRRVLQLGAIDYIMKPFKYERVKQALEHYVSLRREIDEMMTLTQQELDRILHRPESATIPKMTERGSNGDIEAALLPKGLQEQTLKAIRVYLLQQERGCSAEEVSEGIGLARVTARRYLEYLEKSGELMHDVQYGGVGRPVNRYKVKTK